MKYKICSVLLIGLMIFSLSACRFNHKEQTTEVTAEKSYFEANILDITDNAILVEPFEITQEWKSCDQIWVSTKNIGEVKSIEALGTLNIGDAIGIGYLGEVAESYPGQINDVYEVVIVEKGNSLEADFQIATATTENLIVIDKLEGVSMEAVDVTNQSIKLCFLNRTDKIIQFSDDYLLEMKKDGKWYGVDYIIEDWAFHSVAYVVQKDVPTNLNVDWTWLHGVLPEGNYRIVKPVMDFTGTGDFKTYNLGVEFII